MDVSVMVLALAVFSGWAGFEVCQFTHRQKGIDTDEMHVPDFVPDDWTAKADV